MRENKIGLGDLLFGKRFVTGSFPGRTAPLDNIPGKGLTEKTASERTAQEKMTPEKITQENVTQVKVASEKVALEKMTQQKAAPILKSNKIKYSNEMYDRCLSWAQYYLDNSGGEEIKQKPDTVQMPSEKKAPAIRAEKDSTAGKPSEKKADKPIVSKTVGEAAEYKMFSKPADVRPQNTKPASSKAPEDSKKQYIYAESAEDISGNTDAAQDEPFGISIGQYIECKLVTK